MVDMYALGAYVARRGGSSPFIRTKFGSGHPRRPHNKSVKNYGINSFQTYTGC